MTREQLQQIAALVKPHTTSISSRVSFGTRDPAPVESLAALGGKGEATIWDAGHRERPYVIVSSELVIDGVTFDAFYSRDATPEECAALDGPNAHRRVESRISADGLDR